MSDKKLWIALPVVIVRSFLVLGGACYRIISQPRPISTRVVARDGRILPSREVVPKRQNLVIDRRPEDRLHLGHVAYVAPDWTSDRLHREELGRPEVGEAELLRARL